MVEFGMSFVRFVFRTFSVFTHPQYDFATILLFSGGGLEQCRLRTAQPVRGHCGDDR